MSGDYFISVILSKGGIFFAEGCYGYYVILFIIIPALVANQWVRLQSSFMGSKMMTRSTTFDKMGGYWKSYSERGFELLEI